MLLMKWPTAQGGNALSFPHLGITKVGHGTPHPRGAAPKRVGHQSFAVSLFFLEMTDSQFRLKFRHGHADIRGVKPVPAKERVPASLALPGQRFVARQPIFDRAQNVFGYEILFRNGVEDYFNADPELAARATLDSSLLYGIETLCDNKRAFVNCTREFLFKDLITLLPPSQTVAEILETVEPEDRVIAACKRLKAAGYLI